jgi:hypothetical protein
MEHSGWNHALKVTDGWAGLVGHAVAVLPRKAADRAGLIGQLSPALRKELAHAPNPALLDQLPVSPVDLPELPDDISRRLFEALRLEISSDHDHEQVTFRITLTGDTIDVVRRITEAVVLPFRRTRTGSISTGRYASDSGEDRSNQANGDVVPFFMVPPTGFEPVPPP